MATTKRIVILANSDKPGGRCVAGIQLSNPPSWIRPVSARSGQELSWEERRYEDATEPQVLDIVDIDTLEHVPATVQQENWLVDANRRWLKVGSFDRTQLDELVYAGASALWASDGQSRNGLRNRFAPANAGDASDSLRLLHVDDLLVHVEDGWSGRELNGEFTFRGLVYKLRVTDPVFLSAWGQVAHGTYAIGDTYITVSVTEPYVDGNHYKVIAAVITKAP